MSPQTTPHEDDQSIFEALMSLAPDLLASAQAVLEPIAASRVDLRARLLDDGQILPIPTEDAPVVNTMCAVDGARVTEKMYGADLLVAVATTADALSAQRALAPLTAAWAEVVPHMPDVDKIVGTAMADLEIRTAARAEHQYRLLDGSFLSPVVEFSQGLSSKNADVRRRVTALLHADDMPTILTALLTPDPARPVLALPKSETARHYGPAWAKTYGFEPPAVSDRVLVSQILAPGEMLTPRALTEWHQMEVVANSEAAARTRALAAALHQSAEVMKHAASDKTAVTFYFKPPGSGDTVVRVEHHRASGEDVSTSAGYAQMLVGETRAPHAIEPFCQWAVDRRAKAVSRGTQALRAAAVARMTSEQVAAWGWQIARSYRT